MKMAKRFLALTLVLAVALTLVACGSKDTTPTAENAADASAVNTPETDTYPESTMESQLLSAPMPTLSIMWDTSRKHWRWGASVHLLPCNPGA